ncbi:MAG: M24 family metallopeptidase [Syntrophomonadaceae bacterium]|jgi:Xaa-Pro aminopeptidase
MSDRIKRILLAMDKYQVDAFLISKAENIRYLSGFTGGEDAWLLITKKNRYLLTDSRYYEQVEREAPEWDLVKIRPPGFLELKEVSSGINRIAVESHAIAYNTYHQLEQSIETELVPLANVVEEQRQVKDENELQMLREAARIGDNVFTELCCHKIASGVSERMLANEVAYLLRQKGCDSEAFATIAVAGENAALPHGRPSERRLVSGDMLILDFGGNYNGYASDMTRTVAISNSDSKLQARYQAVLEAQELGISLVKAGVACCEIDMAVRECLKKYGLDKYFQHSIGHGLGLEVHEMPSLSSRSNAILQENMVVTVEPGIYIKGWGGIRIEDMVVVKNGGCEVITHSNKSLLII